MTNPTPRKGDRYGGEPRAESDHFMRCRVCGAYFDMRDLDQVIAHEQPGHEQPKPDA